MPDLTQGTQLVSNTSGFALPELESGKFVLIPGGTVGVRNVGAHVNYLGTIVVGSGKSAGTLASVISGLVRYVTQVTPDLTGTGTATTTLTDSSGGTIAALAAQAESVTTAYGTIVPIDSSMKWISSTSGTGQASAMNIVINVHYDL